MFTSLQNDLSVLYRNKYPLTKSSMYLSILIYLSKNKEIKVRIFISILSILLLWGFLIAEVSCPYCKMKNEDEAKICTNCGRWLKIKLVINTIPTHASVFLDKKFIGYTPLTKIVVTGKHFLKVYKLGYTIVSQPLNLVFQSQTNDIRLISKNFSLLQKTDPVEKRGRFFINSKPGEAAVYIDDNAVGQTPYISDLLEPGKYKIKLFLAKEYEVYEERHILKHGTETNNYHKFLPRIHRKSKLPSIARYGGASLTVLGMGLTVSSLGPYGKYKDAKKLSEIKDYWKKTQMLFIPGLICIGIGITAAGSSFILK